MTKMNKLTPIAAMLTMRGLILATAMVVAIPGLSEAQSTPGHVYQLLHWKAVPGSNAAYSQAYREVVRPVWSEIKRQGGIVDFYELAKSIGDTAEASHLIITIFEDWEAYSNFGQAADRASRALFGRPYSEVSGERFVPLRQQVRTEVYLSTGAG